MRIAIVHDYLCGIGGAERVFQYICEEFAEADAYVLAYNPKKALPYFVNRNIKTTWMNRFVQSMDAFRLAFPIATYAMAGLDLSQYDVVLTSSATVAKYVRVGSKAKHICYCYIPTRAIWHFDKYFGRSLPSAVFKLLLPYLKRRDYSAAQAVDQFIAISEDSRRYIKAYYDSEAYVINSPIELDKFAPSTAQRNYYLVVSRLEHWKRVDYAIEAFNLLGLPLRIIGTGKAKSELMAMAKPNIEFVGEVDDITLARAYSEAIAVIFTPFLEYGLIPLEANASGTPAICYGKGGITETMVPWKNGDSSELPATAVFFFEQTAAALVAAVQQFQTLKFDPADLVNHASRWSIPVFKRSLRAAIDTVAKSGCL